MFQLQLSDVRCSQIVERAKGFWFDRGAAAPPVPGAVWLLQSLIPVHSECLCVIPPVLGDVILLTTPHPTGSRAPTRHPELTDQHSLFPPLTTHSEGERSLLCACCHFFFFFFLPRMKAQKKNNKGEWVKPAGLFTPVWGGWRGEEGEKRGGLRFI